MNAKDASLRTRFCKAEIESRISEIAREINETYGDEPLVVICVLKGAFVFFSDLVRQITDPNMELDFVRLSSYGKSDSSSGHVVFGKDTEVDVRGKHVLVVEDIVDSGITMKFMAEQFLARKPLSFRVAALVDKRERRVANINVDFPGFILDKGFLVGYGMDYAERYRTLSDICEIETSPSQPGKE